MAYADFKANTIQLTNGVSNITLTPTTISSNGTLTLSNVNLSGSTGVTVSSSDNSSNLATTAFVKAQTPNISGYAQLATTQSWSAKQNFSTLTASTPATSDNSSKVATTEFVKAQTPTLTGYAQLVSAQTWTATQNFSTITASTPATSDNSSTVATTAFVKAQTPSLAGYAQTSTTQTWTATQTFNTPLSIGHTISSSTNQIGNIISGTLLTTAVSLPTNSGGTFTVTSLNIPPGTWILMFCIQFGLTATPSILIPNIVDNGTVDQVSYNIPCPSVVGYPLFYDTCSSQPIYTNASRLIQYNIGWNSGPSTASFPANTFSGFFKAIRIS
jgi:hypothetical protein